MGTIGQRIKAARDANHLTQARLAKLMNVEQPTVAGWERDTHQPRRQRMETLAKVLRRSIRWFEFGEDDRGLSETQLVGYVGAGSEVIPIDDHEKGAGLDDMRPTLARLARCVAVQIRGDSMYPQLEDGWRLFYSRDGEGVPPECLGRLCVCEIANGPTLVKKVLSSRRPGLYRLESVNASTREDVRLAWATPVLLIEPR